MRSRRRRVVVAVLVAGLLLTGTVGELVARALLAGRVEDAVGRRLGEDADVDVDIEGGLMLYELYDRHLDAVTVRGDDADLGRMEGVHVQVRLDDVRLRQGTVGRTRADVDIPAASLTELASGGDGPRRLEVTGVRTDPGADTVVLQLGGGLGEVTLRPGVEDGRVALHVGAVRVFGRDAPPALVERFEERLSERGGRDGPRRYPLGLEATAVDVTDDGLHVSLSGGPARLPGRG
ncbi:LmeA family phospholipid-binding protein [Streptomyces flavalbus]|uniref:DUF2993 domain-containing protein n=1 Tax=Streptomyces flavalbus TaxID=2665155 RepID=A0ABW2W7X6_9ACTN